MAVHSHASRRVLVVDDHAAVRRLVCQLLRQEGHTVLEAADGPAALDLARAHRGALAMLVTDVEMQPMDGWQVASAVQAIAPDVPVLYISGRATPADAQRSGAPHGHFLRKPFSLPEFREIVHRLLPTP